MILAGQVSWLMTNVREGVRSFIPVLILLVFTLIGGIIFMAIEGPNEQYELKKLKEERDQLLEDTAFRLNSIKGMNPVEAYNHTLKTLVNFRNELGVPNIYGNETKWTIWGAIYYSMTVYTTIGYGNIVPHTSTGQSLTIIYAFIGIPLALISLIALGDLFAKLAMLLWSILLRTCGCFSKKLERKATQLGPSYKSTHSESDASEENEEALLQFPITFLIFLTVLWIFFCAYVFLMFEDHWTYGTSLYFVLISFTTIGFGDVLVSKSKYIIPVACLLLVGLALVSTVLTIIRKQIEAVATGMKDSIDKEYLIALQQANEEADVEEGLENAKDMEESDIKGKEQEDKKSEKKQKSLDEVVKRMPLKSRLLYHLMPAGNRKQLAKHVQARQRVGMQWVQTPEWMIDAGKSVENLNY